MKGKGKGIAASALPFRRKAPKWITMTPSAVSELIVKLAKKGKIKNKLSQTSFINKLFLKYIGLTPSQIGVILRDQHGIPQVRFLTGRKILRVLKKNGLLL